MVEVVVDFVDDCRIGDGCDIFGGNCNFSTTGRAGESAGDEIDLLKNGLWLIINHKLVND